MKKYAITILPVDKAPRPLRLIDTSLSDARLLRLQYYRASSDGWKDEANCDDCVVQFRQHLGHLSNCRLPENCSCNICRRQPPSLRNIRSAIVFRNDRRFELTVNTTFGEYVYAVELGAARLGQLLPPEFPTIRLWFRYDSFDRKFHRNCPGEGSWHDQISRDFTPIADVISALIDKEQKIHFDVLSVTKVSFSLRPALNIPTTKRGTACNRPIYRILSFILGLYII